MLRSQCRVVVTGGPGAGKTTLLAELAARGFETIEESARAIIAARLAQGMTPRPEPATFAREILRRDIDKYRQVAQGSGPIFYDRSAVEALAMLHAAAPLPEEELKSMLSTYAFNRMVFILPPWEAIYVKDTERDHSFAHAVNAHAQLERWYTSCGYQINEVPRLAVAKRAEHVLLALAPDGEQRRVLELTGKLDWDEAFDYKAERTRK
jgi:predicted ATPase